MPVLYTTVPLTVIVPAVLIVKLLRTSPPDHIPVPFKTIAVVPKKTPLTPSVNPPPTNAVFPFNVNAGVVTERVPLRFKLADNVNTVVAVALTLFQVTALALIVADPVKLSVDPDVAIVPKVYVIVPVSKLTVPLTVIVPAVLNVIFFLSDPDPLHIPVPFITMLVVPLSEKPDTVRLPVMLSVNPLMVIVLPLL